MIYVSLNTKITWSMHQQTLRQWEVPVFMCVCVLLTLICLLGSVNMEEQRCTPNRNLPVTASRSLRKSCSRISPGTVPHRGVT